MQQEDQPVTLPLYKVCCPRFTFYFDPINILPHEALGECFQSSDSTWFHDKIVDHVILEIRLMKVTQMKRF